MAPSRISSAGMCGRKSLPTKKHMKTKSSISSGSATTTTSKHTHACARKLARSRQHGSRQNISAVIRTRGGGAGTDDTLEVEPARDARPIGLCELHRQILAQHPNL